MSVFDRAINRLNDMDSIIRKLIDDIITSPEFEYYITELNREQMFAGIRADKTPIGDKKPYKPQTIKRKTAKGQPTDRVTLKDTGAFYDSLKVRHSANKFEIIGTDSKTLKLKGDYEPTILGLTDENLNYVMDMVKKKLIERLAQHGLK